MEKNKKKIVIISVVVILVVAVAVAAAVILTKPEKSLYQDTYVEVTDENGDIVFDENGNVVTELATNKESISASNASQAGSTTKGSGNSSDPSDTTQASTNGNNNNTSSAAATTKPTTESTTKKPEKRTVSLEIKLPFYNNKETELIVVYSVDGKPMEKLDLSKCKITVNDGEFNNADDIKLGKIVLESGLITIELPDKIKGDVSFAIDFLDVKLQGNNVTIPASDEVGRIKPATGIEALDGEFD